MKRTIHFVTHNKEKVELLKSHLTDNEIEVVQTQLSIVEPQANSIEAVALSKAMQAFKILKQSVIVEDSGFYIDELAGFPGPYTKYVLETIGISGLLKLAEQLSSKRCKFISVLAYINSDGVPRTFFDDSDEGSLSTEIDNTACEEAWSDLWRIFVPVGYQKPLTALAGEEKAAAYQKWLSNSGFAQFAEWFQGKTPDEVSHEIEGDRLMSKEFEFPVPRERIAIRPRPQVA